MPATGVSPPPAPIAFADEDDCATTVQFHPTDVKYLAIGHIDGRVTVHSIGPEGSSSGGGGARDSVSGEVAAHQQSCRCVGFTGDGSRLLSASKDRSIALSDPARSKLVQRVGNAHKSAIYTLYVLDDHLFATGDEDGHVKLWDLRAWCADGAAVASWRESEDYVSDMTSDSDGKLLLATSGEGTLTALDVRNKKLVMQSELFDTEFLSIDTVKSGSKVVCGGSDGVLHLFHWSQWGNISDRYPITDAADNSVDCLRTLAPDLLCAGCADGTIKLVHVLPNYIVCDDICDRRDGEGSDPVVAMSLNSDTDNPLLAACTHTNVVTFYSPQQHLNTRKHKTVAADTKKKAKTRAPPRVKPKSGGTATATSSAASDFFSDLPRDS